MKQVYGFGVTVKERTLDETNHFKVIQPVAKNDPVTAVEVYVEGGRIKTVERAAMTQDKWNLIKGAVEHEFNTRLKKTGLKGAKFNKGETPVDRFLGREVTILFLACQNARTEEVEAIAANWACLTPEERWWFYRRALGEKTRWNKVLYLALAS